MQTKPQSVMRPPRRRWLWGALIVAALAGVLIWLAWPPADPLYHGTRLSAHLEKAKVQGIAHVGNGFHRLVERAPEPGLQLSSMEDETREAIQHVGVDALPLLVGMLQGEPRFDRWRRALVGKYGLPKFLLPRNPSLDWLNKTRALAAFSVLTTNAAPVVDDIIPLLDDPDHVAEAIVALMLIRPEHEEQILALTNAFRVQPASPTGRTPELIRTSALLALGSFGTQASGAIPYIVPYLSSTNRREQAAASVALTRLEAPPELVVPAVIQMLGSNSLPTTITGARDIVAMSTTLWNLWALEQFGAKAVDALPALKQLERSRISNIADSARRATDRIHAESALPAASDR